MFCICYRSKCDWKNEVTLKFSGANEYDGYVQYDNVGKIQLFKGEELVTNIHDGIVIDLNEAEYKLKITEIEDKTSTGASGAVIKTILLNYQLMGGIILWMKKILFWIVVNFQAC